LKAGDEKEDKEQVFRPAYELVEDEAERLGRDW
jgi:FAD synthetase